MWSDHTPPQRPALERAWSQLAETEQAAAKLLGWTTEQAWDQQEPLENAVCWDALGANRQYGAAMLGYDRSGWDAVVATVFLETPAPEPAPAPVLGLGGMSVDAAAFSMTFPQESPPQQSSKDVDAFAMLGVLEELGLSHHFDCLVRLKNMAPSII